MDDDEIARLAIHALAVMGRARTAYEDALEAFNHACKNHDWAAAEDERARVMDTLSILLNAIKASHRYSEGSP